jgi:cysteate synthase
MGGKYLLRCLEGNEVVRDEYTLNCPEGHASLLRTEYAQKQLQIRNFPGIFRFLDWLPIERTLPIDSGPVCFRSEGLSRELHLPNLFIGFNGYWPEKGANIATCSFKELEALPTVIRQKERRPGVLVIASAGNTARAFLQVSALTGTPVVVVVPETALPRLWTTAPAERALILAVRGDYTDAIRFSGQVCTLPHLLPEGGAKNVARRDGMGTVMLDGTVTIGRMPDYYFQAVGSGTGGISAWEAALRLREDGRFGPSLPELHLCQNLPFVPMVSAWNERRRLLIPERDMPDAKRSIEMVYSDVLTNREPPYSIRGGVFDALSDTEGKMYAVSNDEARSAEKLFMETEGIDLDPAASVCIASLIAACETGAIKKEGRILLNITGGGYGRVREDHALIPVSPALTVPAGAGVETITKELGNWVRLHV